MRTPQSRRHRRRCRAGPHYRRAVGNPRALTPNPQCRPHPRRGRAAPRMCPVQHRDPTQLRRGVSTHNPASRRLWSRPRSNPRRPRKIRGGPAGRRPCRLRVGQHLLMARLGIAACRRTTNTRRLRGARTRCMGSVMPLALLRGLYSERVVRGEGARARGVLSPSRQYCFSGKINAYYATVRVFAHLTKSPAFVRCAAPRGRAQDAREG